ncbi:MAG: hypothetical protein Q7T88_08705 [Methylotenera sp.]|nr:hypothetical protein [Methylotenera sp.]
MDLTNSDFIAIGSALVAGLSALYARWAVKASKHQNEISLHAERLNVYKGVTIFGSKLAANGPSIQDADVWKFHEWVQLSEFYYNTAIHKRLDAAFTQALAMLAKSDEWKLAKEQGSSNAKEISDERHKIHRALRDESFSISDAMKENLRLAKA